MNKKSRIYIAGHTGLVGSSFFRRLKDEGCRNLIFKTSAELDLRRQFDVEKFFERNRPEYVFLAAARVGGILANNTYKAEFIYDNIMISANIISSSHRYGVKKLLNLGSSCIYPRLAPQPMKERSLLAGPLEPTNEPYAIAKISAIKLCRYYNEQYGTEFISVMPTNLYGPGDNFNMETAHLLPAIIRKMHLAKLINESRICEAISDIKNYAVGFGLDKILARLKSKAFEERMADIGITGKCVTLWGDGKARRELMYIDDLTEACFFLMKNYGPDDIGEFVNIGTGRDESIADIAEIIKKVVGFKGRIRYDKSKPSGMPRKLLDISRINRLGWKSKVGLDEGIKELYKWYLANAKRKDRQRFLGGRSAQDN